jgi:hypothetical protein
MLLIQMIHSKKMPTKRQVLDRIESGSLRLPPLTIRLQRKRTRPRDLGPDAIVEIESQGQSIMCAVEIKTLSTPRVIRDAVSQIKHYAAQLDAVPLLIAPFLRDEQLQELERNEVCGIDLCGNGSVVIPGQVTVYRTGVPNSFRPPTAIRNIYKRNTSVVGRVFLVCPTFQSVSQIQNEIEKRTFFDSWWKPIRLSTVSKALKSLEEDTFVRRKGNLIRLLQAEKLLEKLSENYTALRLWPAEQAPSLKLRVPLEEDQLLSLLARISAAEGLPIIGAGVSSTWMYATAQRGPMLTVYCPFVERLLGEINGEETDRSPNLEIIEAVEQFVYFDSREKAGFRWASPVQTYLELASGDKSQRETAEEVKNKILSSQHENDSTFA